MRLYASDNSESKGSWRGILEYRKTIILKDGRICILRNGTEKDGKAVLDNFILTHGQTDNLLSYPDESDITAEQEAHFLKSKTESASEIEILAEVNSFIAGLAGIDQVGSKYKVRHRADFGISVDQAYWGLGIGRALMEERLQIPPVRVSGTCVFEIGIVRTMKMLKTMSRLCMRSGLGMSI